MDAMVFLSDLLLKHHPNGVHAAIKFMFAVLVSQLPESLTSIFSPSQGIFENPLFAGESPPQLQQQLSSALSEIDTDENDLQRLRRSMSSFDWLLHGTLTRCDTARLWMLYLHLLHFGFHPKRLFYEYPYNCMLKEDTFFEINWTAAASTHAASSASQPGNSESGTEGDLLKEKTNVMLEALCRRLLLDMSSDDEEEEEKDVCLFLLTNYQSFQELFSSNSATVGGDEDKLAFDDDVMIVDDDGSLNNISINCKSSSSSFHAVVKGYMEKRPQWSELTSIVCGSDVSSLKTVLYERGSASSNSVPLWNRFAKLSLDSGNYSDFFCGLVNGIRCCYSGMEMVRKKA